MRRWSCFVGLAWTGIEAEFVFPFFFLFFFWTVGEIVMGSLFLLQGLDVNCFVELVSVPKWDSKPTLSGYP